MQISSSEMPGQREPRSTTGLDLPLEDTATISPKLAEALTHWRGLCQDDGPPHWESFDPIKIAPLLPRVILYKCLEGKENFYIQIMGEHAADFLQFNGHGKMLHEVMPPSNLEEVVQRLNTLRALKSPQLVQKTLDWQQREYVDYWVLLLPFLDAANCVCHVLSVFDFRYGNTDRSCM